MRHPVISDFRSLLIRRSVCIGLSLAIICVFAEPGRMQSQERLTITSDRNKPREAPKKVTTPVDSRSNQSSTGTSSSQGGTGPLSGCVFNDILVLDTIRIVFVQLFNFPPNSAIPATLTQTNAGVVGFALTSAGPFTPTLNTMINTDSNGNGVSVDIYIQGQLVGQTTTYADTPFGSTDTITFNVLPQCNCPAIPAVP